MILLPTPLEKKEMDAQRAWLLKASKGIFIACLSVNFWQIFKEKLLMWATLVYRKSNSISISNSRTSLVSAEGSSEASKSRRRLAICGRDADATLGGADEDGAGRCEPDTQPIAASSPTAHCCNETQYPVASLPANMTSALNAHFCKAPIGQL